MDGRTDGVWIELSTPEGEVVFRRALPSPRRPRETYAPDGTLSVVESETTTSNRTVAVPWLGPDARLQVLAGRPDSPDSPVLGAAEEATEILSVRLGEIAERIDPARVELDAGFDFPVSDEPFGKTHGGEIRLVFLPDGFAPDELPIFHAAVTAFLHDFADGVLTARHVIEELATDHVLPEDASAATIDFAGEVGSAATCTHRLGKLLTYGPEWINRVVRGDGWDYALVALGDAIDGAARPAPVLPQWSRRRMDDGEAIAVVGYPARPPVPPSVLLEGTIWHRLLGGLYNVKRFAPGMLLPSTAGPASYHAPDARVLLHDATTVGGVSGGAVLTIGGCLGAIHLGGQEGAANLALGLYAVAARNGWLR